MFTAYVLKSLKDNKRYVGHTSKDASQRTKEHNYGSNAWTKNHSPFVLVHEEYYETKREAIIRERFLKSGQGRKYLDIILKDDSKAPR